LGKVDIVSLELRFVTTAAAQKVTAGMSNANATLTENQVGMGLFGHCHVSNQFNMGIESSWKFVVPDIYSAQVQPASSMVPGFKFYLNASASVRLNLIIFLKFHGPMILRREGLGN